MPDCPFFFSFFIAGKTESIIAITKSLVKQFLMKKKRLFFPSEYVYKIQYILSLRLPATPSKM